MEDDSEDDYEFLGWPMILLPSEPVGHAQLSRAGDGQSHVAAATSGMSIDMGASSKCARADMEAGGKAVEAAVTPPDKKTANA